MADYQDSLSEVETEISKPKRSRESPRPRSAGRKSLKKKGTSGKGSPYKGVASTNALSTKSARDLWINAVKSGTGGIGTNKKGTANHLTPQEYWTETLRASGAGFNTRKSESITGLKQSQLHSMSYASTSHYLRQTVGTEKQGGKMIDPLGKGSPGTPAYRSPEEYYDEVLALKKNIQGITSENSTLKLKIRRLEEDNIKKEKQIDQLLDPSKSEEMRRTLTDKRPDSSTVIHSFKQKIMKLETQLKDREAALGKLQSDLKTTKIEEMKSQMQTFYKEILRLKQLKSIPAETSLSRTAPAGGIKETPSRMKALQETIKRMNDNNLRLQADNKAMKEDIQKLMEHKETSKAKHREYDDMSKNDLLSAIGKLEKRLDKQHADTYSMQSDIDNRHQVTEGKIVLEGSVAQRLDQLDKRETELLQDLSKEHANYKKSHENVQQYRKKITEKDKQIRDLKKEIGDLRADLDSFYSKDGAITPRTPRPDRQRKASPRTRTSRSSSLASDDRQRQVEQFRQNRAAKQIQKQWKRHHAEDERVKETAIKAENIRQNHAARCIQSRWKNHQTQKAEEEETQYKVQQFTKKRAALRIQRGWIHHQHIKIEHENSDAAELIQASLRGHHARSVNVKRMRGFVPEDDTSLDAAPGDTDLDSAAESIQNAYRGHKFRKEQISRTKRSPSPFSRTRLKSDTVYADEDSIRIVQASMRAHNMQKKYIKQYSNRTPSPRFSHRKELGSAGEEEESEETPPHSARRPPSGRRSPSRQSSGWATPQKFERASTYDDDDYDDDDDIVTAPRKNKGGYF